jgi:hypothetical protein
MSNGIGISADEDTVESVLKRNYKYRVPNYQRRYSWTEDQWRELWDDIDSLGGDRQHFLGSMVVIERNGGLNDINVLEVVDGQQRLTTLSLILAAIRERYRDEGQNEIVEAINEDYLWEREIDMSRHQNLELSRFDNEAYKTIISGEENTGIDSQLIEALKFYQEKVSALSIEELDELYRRILRSITIVSIKCDSEQSAFKLFETLNNRGLELSAVDLMKNHLFSIAVSNPSIDYSLVQSKWEDIIDLIVPTLRKPSRFFRHYIMSAPIPNHPDDVSEYKLYETFKDIIDNKLSASGLSVEKYITDLAQRAETYIEIVECDIAAFHMDANDAINRKLRHLEAIGSVQARTLMLRIFREFDNPNRVVESLQLLETFLIRWKTANYATGGELDRIYSRLCSEGFGDDQSTTTIQNLFSERGPSDAEFKAGIENKRAKLNNRTKYMLTTLEKEYFGGEEITNVFDIDLEHVAPRAAFSASRYTTWPATLNTDEGTFEQYRDRLGNLTLLESEMNFSIGANPYLDKQDAYRESKFEMTNHVANQYEEWGIATIQDRTELLAAAAQVWSFD